MREIDSLRAHYDTTDATAELESARLDESMVDEPMVGITVRLPASTLDAARRMARADGVKVTALLRQWVEQRVAEGVDDDHVVPVADLKRLIARSAPARRIG